MADQGFDLADVFDLALNSMRAERQQVNDLDGYNGNHGDNMVANLEMITKALREHSEGSPTEALTSAAEQGAFGRAGWHQSVLCPGTQPSRRAAAGARYA